MGVNSERRSHVAVAEHLLHNLHIRPFPNEGARQAMAQVVEPEADLLAFLTGYLGQSQEQCGSEVKIAQVISGKEWLLR